MLAVIAQSGPNVQQQKGSHLSRFEDKFIPEPMSGCWLWIGAMNSDGYGSFRGLNGNSVLAHRFSYEAFRGQLKSYPEYEIDHLCKTRCCVNPFHLEQVKHDENVRRGNVKYTAQKVNGSKTHCKRGHEYTEENTYTYKRSHGIQRQCVKCRALANKKRYGK